MTGNRCGHNPDLPRTFEVPAGHRSRPKLLIVLGDAVMDYYAHPEKTLPSLNAANHSDRRQRSERREACLLLLRAVIHYTDLISLEVGVPRADGSIGSLTLERLSTLTQLGARRTARAMKDLKTAGILNVKTRCRRTADGNFRGEAAIKSLSPHVFAIFGLDRWLGHEQRRAAERKQRYRQKTDRKSRAQFRLVADALLTLSGGVTPKVSLERTQRANLEFEKIRKSLGIGLSACSVES